MEVAVVLWREEIKRSACTLSCSNEERYACTYSKCSFLNAQPRLYHVCGKFNAQREPFPISAFIGICLEN